jgi:hypothetical protein
VNKAHVQVRPVAVAGDDVVLASLAGLQALLASGYMYTGKSGGGTGGTGASGASGGVGVGVGVGHQAGAVEAYIAALHRNNDTDTNVTDDYADSASAPLLLSLGELVVFPVDVEVGWVRE